MSGDRLILERRGTRLLAARVESDRLVELFAEDAVGERVTDRFFRARVSKIDRTLQAAFLDIGAGQPALLNAKDARHLPDVSTSASIDRIVHEGQRLIVQGLREAGGGKGPRVTTDLRLIGFALVHRPHADVLEVSRNLGKGHAAQLLERGRSLLGEGGFVLRRAALELPDAVLLDEAARLRARARDLLAAAGAGRPGPLGDDAETPLARLLRTVLGHPVAMIEAVDPALLAEARALVAALGERAPEVVGLAAGSGAFEAAGIAEDLDRARAVDVPLDGGGRIRIEPTAALVAIDVDAGPSDPMTANLAAAEEIARQARLRNLGGIIVVDFIGVGGRRERQRVVDRLRRAFAKDPLSAQIHDVSPLGLVEIGRPRRGATLASLLGP